MRKENNDKSPESQRKALKQWIDQLSDEEVSVLHKLGLGNREDVSEKEVDILSNFDKIVKERDDLFRRLAQ